MDAYDVVDAGPGGESTESVERVWVGGGGGSGVVYVGVFGYCCAAAVAYELELVAVDAGGEGMDGTYGVVGAGVRGGRTASAWEAWGWGALGVVVGFVVVGVGAAVWAGVRRRTRSA